MPSFRFPPVDRESVRQLPAQIRELATLANSDELSEQIIRCAMRTEFAIGSLLERLEAKESSAAGHAKRITQMEYAHAQRMQAQIGNIAAFHAPKSSFDPRIFRGYFLYILWGDDAKQPVYVGQSTNILSRLSSHMNDTLKRKLTRRIQLLRCKTAAEMVANETRLIRHYRPLLNKAGNNVDNETECRDLDWPLAAQLCHAVTQFASYAIAEPVQLALQVSA
jgi:hypothetical protein